MRRSFHSVVRPPFVVIGNLPARRLGRIADGSVARPAQAMWRSYFTRKPTDVITVYLLRDAQSYRKTAKRLFNDTDLPHFGYYKPARRAMVMNINTGTGTLVHELTHALISYDFPRVPTWFNEGLANWVSGTGEDRVTRDEGIAEIRAGRVMAPDDTGQFPLPKTPADYGLSWPMLHVQSLLFVEYLALRDRDAFDVFLGEVLDGEDFGPSFVRQFGAGPDILWREFTSTLE